MNTVEQKTNSEDLVKTLIEKAWENPEFKDQLISNPAKTISGIVGKELGSTMPNGKEIVIVDQTDESKFYLNIPSKPELDYALSDEQLDHVSGGAGGPLYDAGVWVGHQIKDFYNWATS